MKQLLLLIDLIFQMKVALLSSWNYSVNGGSYQIPNLHDLQTITSETQHLMVIKSCRFYELWLNGFNKHGKQKEFQIAKSLGWQHNDGNKWHYLVVKKLSALFRGITLKNKGQCTTGPTTTTAQSSKQLIKKFWHTVQSIILKKSNFGPNLTFWPPWGLGKSFPKGNIYIVGSVLLVSNFMQKIKKMCHAVQKIFLKKSILGPKFDILTPGGPGQEFSWG